MIDYVKLEEKLIKSELSVRDCIKERETLAKIDKILYKYDSRTPEQLNASLKTSESLSNMKKFRLPLKVRGTMLGTGRHKERYYKETELKRAVAKYKGKVIPIKLDHKDKEVGSTVGVVDRLFWIPATKSIGYEGHINDVTHALNILDGVITDVSATIYSMKLFDDEFGVIGVDLDFSELSLVSEGAFKGNTLTPVL